MVPVFVLTQMVIVVAAVADVFVRLFAACAPLAATAVTLSATAVVAASVSALWVPIMSGAFRVAVAGSVSAAD